MYRNKLRLSIIVAMGQDRAIGFKNSLPWHLPRDLRYYKNITWGQTTILGRNTYNSILINRVPMLGRQYVVVSKQLASVPKDVQVCQDIKSAFDYCCEKLFCKHAFVIGGGQIYEATMPYIDTIYMTKIEGEFKEADTFFPELSEQDWELKSTKYVDVDEHNTFPCSFNHYVRKLQ